MFFAEVKFDKKNINQEGNNESINKTAAKVLTESKPPSLKLYEKEIAGAEKQLISKSLREKLSGEVVETERNLKVEHISRLRNEKN